MEEFRHAPPSVVLCYPQTILIDEAGDIIRPYDDGLDLREPSPHERVRKLLRNMGLTNAAFGLMRTDALRRTRRIDGFNDSDLALLLELALLGQFHEVPEPLLRRRLHDGQAYRANTTHDAVLRWFDPSRASRSLMPRAKLFMEMVRSISHAPLPAAERARAGAVLAREWGPKYLCHSVREASQVVRESARGRLPALSSPE